MLCVVCGVFVQPTAIPCLVVPSSLKGFADPSTSFKQVLTIYNPFNHPIDFKVLATFPAHYIVSPSSGTLQERSSVYVFVQPQLDHVMLPKDYATDKFLVEVSDGLDEPSLLGKQVVAVKYDPISTSSSSIDSLANSNRSRSTSKSSSASSGRGGGRGKGDTSAGLTMVSRLSPLFFGVLFMLFLSSPQLHSFEHTAALWIAFFGGMITMLIQMKFLEIEKQHSS